MNESVQGADWIDAPLVRHPQYCVVVHDDSEHTFPYVMELLSRVCGHGEKVAYQLTHRIHFSGHAPVWRGSLEVAELKCEQIQAFRPRSTHGKLPQRPLTVTIEPMVD